MDKKIENGMETAMYIRIYVCIYTYIYIYGYIWQPFKLALWAAGHQASVQSQLPWNGSQEPTARSPMPCSGSVGNGGILGFYWGYMGIVNKKRGTTMMGYISKHKLTPHLTCIYSTLWFSTHSESTPEIYIINPIQPFQKPYPPTNCFELIIFENNLNQSNLVLF